MVEKASCTHANAGTAKFCPDCGEKLSDESVDRLASRITGDVEKLLQNYGLKKKTVPPGSTEDEEDEPKDELERILSKKKKK